MENNGFDIEITYNRGRAFEELGQVQDATKDFETILEKEPKHLNANLSIAKMAYESGNYSKALLVTSKLIDYHQDSYQAHFWLARAKHHLGQAESAMESYGAAISLNKNFGDAYYFRGALKTTLKLSSACEDLKTAQRLKVQGADAAVKKHCS